MGATTGLDVTMAISLAAIIVIAYTAAGGLLADVYSDLIQGIAIVAGLLAVMVFITIEAGGPVQGLAAVDSARFLPMRQDQPLLDFVEQWAIPICGSLVAVELISRVLACKSPNVARSATQLGGIGYLLIALIPVYFGLVGARLAPGLEEAEQIVPTLAQKYLPAIVYVMFAGALISAILSSVDSALLAAASLVSHNLVLRVRPNLTEAAKVRMGRAGVAVLGLVAYVLALRAEGISALVEMASAFGSAGVFVASVFGLFTRFGGPASAYASMAAGMIVWGGGSLLGVTTPYVLALAVAAVTYVIVAILDRSRE
jgi:Na+/proline symporter